MLVLIAIGFLLFWDVVYLLFGLIFVRFKFSHRFALRCLAMTMLFPKRMLPHRCRLDCETVDCKNWTCSAYNQYPNQ